MSKQWKILFATDFSPAAKVALQLLHILKQKSRLDVCFIHVIASFWRNWLSSGLQQKEAQQRLEHWQKEVTEEIDPEKLFITVDNAADAILAQAQQSNVDLILLGGGNNITNQRYKSRVTIESVIRHAGQSVLVCKTPKVDKILCGIDGSPASAKALHKAIELARLFNAKLTILSAIPKMNAQALGMSEQELVAQEETLKIEYAKKIDDFLQAFDFADIDVHQQLSWGAAAHVILDMAEDFDYDMVVVGDKGHSLLRHICLGSTTEKVLKFISCSLLVVK